MRYSSKGFLAFAFTAIVFGSVSVFAASSAQTLNLPEAESSFVVEGDDVPDVTARVARISFISGAARIKRLDSKNWENATLNLPMVEGDEIATDNGSRIEIQFDNYQHLRLTENSFLKLATLKDSGIALSLSLGSMSVRVTSFDKEKAYFEIDAPQTTLAVQKAGTFRIDAGREGDSDIRVAATDGGEARVYSDNAGFTLKNGRSTTVHIAGSNAGEWETADASRFMDEFDSWAADRDRVIAKRIKDAYYDQYYDRDIYAADDLDGYGDWVHTQTYGYVWRPGRASISRYADWSPYRYGHWRWIPPYGWTWVNDEPWGWATYHHGRWIYDNGYWCWSPYGYYRPSRSWWSPALVVISVFNNNICWYPLGYHRRYYNYNWNNNHYGGIRHNNNHNNNNPPVYGPTGGIKPIPTRSPAPTKVLRKPDSTGEADTGGPKVPIDDRLPPGGVVMVDKDDFGTTVKGPRKAPVSVATAILSKQVDNSDLPTLPVYKDLSSRVTRDINADTPRTVPVVQRTKVGAETRKTNEPMDETLRTTRVFGGRPPNTKMPDTGGIRPGMGGNVEPRKTGAIDRTPPVRQDTENTPTRQPPVYVPQRERVQKDTQVQTDTPPRYDPPPTRQPTRTERAPKQDQPQDDSPAPTRQPPRYVPPPRVETPKNDPPPTRQPPRSDPQPTRQPPRTETPKSEPKPERKSPPTNNKAVDDGL